MRGWRPAALGSRDRGTVHCSVVQISLGAIRENLRMYYRFADCIRATGAADHSHVDGSTPRCGNDQSHPMIARVERSDTRVSAPWVSLRSTQATCCALLLPCGGRIHRLTQPWSAKKLAQEHRIYAGLRDIAQAFEAGEGAGGEQFAERPAIGQAQFGRQLGEGVENKRPRMHMVVGHLQAGIAEYSVAE